LDCCCFCGLSLRVGIAVAAASATAFVDQARLMTLPLLLWIKPACWICCCFSGTSLHVGNSAVSKKQACLLGLLLAKYQ
jgi:hypothetical protein